MGFAGGMHCVGMCGGIVAALSLGGRGHWWPGVTLYHITRIATYAVIGLALGWLGGMITQSGAAAGAQKALSIIAGVVMIFFALQIGGWIPERFGNLTGFSIPSKFLRKAAEERSLFAWAVVGIANGLLPCGLVYAALALAVNSANPVSGAMFMFAFGLGTAPSLLAFGAVVRLISPALRGLLMKIAAIALVLFGLFMIARVTVMKPHVHHHDHGGQQMDMSHEGHDMGQMNMPMDHMGHDMNNQSQPMNHERN